MKPSRSVVALRQMREHNLDRLFNVDADLATRLRSVLSNGLPWFRVLKNNEAEELEQVVEEAEQEAPQGPTKSTVLIYEEIGGSFGISANEFVDTINGLDTDELEIRINSPGGALFDGITIYNALNAHPAFVRTVVDGIAASAASIVAMAGDEIVMMPGSQLMIHDAMGVVTGNKADMDAMSKFLDRQSDNIASIYAYRNGDDSEEAIKNWRGAMLAETWYMSNEAVESGLADKVYLKPKKSIETGEAMEADIEEDDEGQPVPPSEEDDETENIQNLLHRPHRVRNSKYQHDRRKAPKPYMPPKQVAASAKKFDVHAFTEKAKELL